jgi:hypothetical protein
MGYSHRQDWLEKRIFELCNIFAVEVYAFAVMDRFLFNVLDKLICIKLKKGHEIEKFLIFSMVTFANSVLSSGCAKVGTFGALLMEKAFKVFFHE